MGNNSRPRYQHTYELDDGTHVLGPVIIAGQPIFIDPSGSRMSVVEELLARQKNAYQNSGRGGRVFYEDGRLVERVKMGTAQGPRRVSVPVSGTHTERELQREVERLYKGK